MPTLKLLHVYREDAGAALRTLFNAMARKRTADALILRSLACARCRYLADLLPVVADPRVGYLLERFRR